MKISDLSQEYREFFEQLQTLKHTNRPGYISAVCMLIRNTPINESSATWAMLKNTSKNDFKRAIRCLRCAQAEYPYRENIESTIAYIRREWLKKEVVA